MTSVFDFIDFREYLQRYFRERKNDNRHFSYQLLAQKAGFNNRGFMHSIIKGSKRISKSHCDKISHALGHKKSEAEFFKNIVAYGQAKNDDERSLFLERALQIRSVRCTEVQLIRKDQYEFYSTWYHSAVRSIIGMYPFRNEFEQLGRKLSPSITVAQARESVRLLDRLGLIVKGEDGIYRIAEKKIRVSEDISQTAKNRFHGECIDLAKKAIANAPPGTRNVISLTLGISRPTIEIIRNETEQFKNRMIELAANDENADCVYQYQFISFPLSNDGKIG
jgi:uncharacterized protein (TIGR02147 family)